ncbi:MAG: hypothetical protein ACM3JB_11175 [Acidobacteriaceae bacterium]
MGGDQRDIVEILRYELNCLEQGEFARAIGEGRASSPFQDTLSCLNYGEPLRPHACHECFLYEFVPEHARTEEVPCHHIPLDPAGRTIADFLKSKDAVGLERALKIWLRRTIAELELEAGTRR